MRAHLFLPLALWPTQEPTEQGSVLQAAGGKAEGEKGVWSSPKYLTLARLYCQDGQPSFSDSLFLPGGCWGPVREAG